MNKMIANFERLWALELVSRLGSVTAAAAELSISQPALSRKLLLLAEELGFALLARQGRRVAVTERASALLASVRPAFAVLDAFASRTAAIGGQQQLIVFPLRDPHLMKQVTSELESLRAPYANRVEVSSFEVARVLIRGAYGFGYLPERVALEDLRRGVLQRMGRLFGEHLAVCSSHPVYLRAHGDVVRQLAALVSNIARPPW